MLAFTILASMLTGILCGLVPAFQLSRADPGDALKDGDRGGSGAHGRADAAERWSSRKWRLSLVLLAAAGLLVRSLIACSASTPASSTERAIVMQLVLPRDALPGRGRR